MKFSQTIEICPSGIKQWMRLEISSQGILQLSEMHGAKTHFDGKEWSQDPYSGFSNSSCDATPSVIEALETLAQAARDGMITSEEQFSQRAREIFGVVEDISKVVAGSKIYASY
ncbi:MAG: hypothetical protein JXR35_06205 [Rhodobacteraceae bacterium]|nr:hypothetical protein [Paracoccaceae bacterium]